jgi:hypothetical protein
MRQPPARTTPAGHRVDAQQNRCTCHVLAKELGPPMLQCGRRDRQSGPVSCSNSVSSFF